MITTITYDCHQQELVARCLAGDDPAWEQFFEEHDPAIRRGVHHALGGGHHDPDTVEDHTQDVRILLCKRPRLLRLYEPSEGSLDAYLAGIASREVTRFYQKCLRRKIQVHFIPTSHLPLPLGVEGPEHILLEEFLTQLTPTEREFFLVELLGTAPESARRFYTDDERWQYTHRIKEEFRRFCGLA